MDVGPALRRSSGTVCALLVALACAACGGAAGAQRLAGGVGVDPIRMAWTTVAEPSIDSALDSVGVQKERGGREVSEALYAAGVERDRGKALNLLQAAARKATPESVVRLREPLRLVADVLARSGVAPLSSASAEIQWVIDSLDDAAALARAAGAPALAAGGIGPAAAVTAVGGGALPADAAALRALVREAIRRELPVAVMASGPAGLPRERLYSEEDVHAVAPSAALLAGEGFLRVESTPSGAAVILDGRRVGETPLFLQALSAGFHPIELRHGPRTVSAGYALVAADEVSHLTVAVGAEDEGPPGAVTVLASRLGASISVDGVPVATAPDTVRGLRPGRHRVAVRDGALAWETDVLIRPGQTALVRADLVPGGGAPGPGLASAADFDAAAAAPAPAPAPAAAPALAAPPVGAAGSGVADAAPPPAVALWDDAPGAAATVAAGAAATVAAGAEPVQPPASEPPFVYLGLSLSEGALFVEGRDAVRTNVGLELAAALRFAWFRAELAGALTVESPVAFLLRPGVRADFGPVPVYARVAVQLLTTPVVTTGFLFGLGGDVPLPADWSLFAELDVSLWLQQTGVVPLEGRLGVRYGF